LLFHVKASFDTPHQLLKKSIMTHIKIMSLAQAIAHRQTIKTLVFTNGIFDLFHVGHLTYLEQARELGTALFVGLNSDQSTTTLKGPKRPLISESDRAKLLASLECVAGVIIFGELTVHQLIDKLRPEIYVKGGDYALPSADDDQSSSKPVLHEASLVYNYGGQVILIPYQAGYSTTELIDRIVERYCE